MIEYLEKLQRLEALETLYEEMTISYFVNLLSIQSMNVGIKLYLKLRKETDGRRNKSKKMSKNEYKEWVLNRLHYHMQDRTGLKSQLFFIKANLDTLAKERNKILEEMNIE